MKNKGVPINLPIDRDHELLAVVWENGRATA
jgi:hypothetical protein